MNAANDTEHEKWHPVIADHWRLIGCRNNSALVHSAAGDIARIAKRLSEDLLDEITGAEITGTVSPIIIEKACKDVLVILNRARGILERSEKNRDILERETTGRGKHRGLLAAV